MQVLSFYLFLFLDTKQLNKTAVVPFVSPKMARSYQGKGHNTCWDPVRLHSQPGGLCESDWDLKSLRVCQHCYVHQRVWGNFQRTYVTNCTSMACQLNGQLSMSASQTPTCRDWMQASLPIRIDVHLCLSMLLLSSWHNRRLNVGWHSLRHTVHRATLAHLPAAASAAHSSHSRHHSGVTLVIVHLV